MSIFHIYELVLKITDYLSVSDIKAALESGLYPPALVNDWSYFGGRALRLFGFPIDKFKLENTNGFERYCSLQLLLSSDRRCRLVKVIKDGDLQALKDLYAVTDKSIITSFRCEACAEGHLHIVDWYLSEGLCENDNSFSWMSAVGTGQNHVAKFLINDKRYTIDLGIALIRAMGYDNTDIIDYILTVRKDNIEGLYHPNVAGEILNYAIVNKNYELVCKILSRPEASRLDKNRGLNLACKHGFIECVELFLKDTDETIHALYDAITYGRVGVVRLLLERGRLDPSVRGNEALTNAVGRKNHEIVQMLLADKRVSSDKTGGGFFAVIDYKRLDYLKLLFPSLEYLSDKDMLKRYTSGLYKAIDLNWYEGVEYMLGQIKPYNIKVDHDRLLNKVIYNRSAKTEAIYKIVTARQY